MNLMREDYQRIVESLKKRDARVFSDLYDEYAPALYALILQMINDKELAGLVLTKTFVLIWENIELYDHSKQRLFTWMVNIARKTTLETPRSLVPRKCIKMEGVNFLGNTERLDLQSQRLIHLSYFKGYGMKEIAEIEGLPVTVLKTTILNALKHLSDKIEQNS